MTKKAKKVAPPQPIDEGSPPVEDAAPAPTATLTTAQVAEQLDTTPRTLRKFLRSKASSVEPVGQGRRYALSAQSLPKLAAQFEAWVERDDDADDAEAAVVEADPEITGYTADELDEGFTVAELRDMIHDSLGPDHVPSKGTKKAKLIDILTA